MIFAKDKRKHMRQQVCKKNFHVRWKGKLISQHWCTHTHTAQLCLDDVEPSISELHLVLRMADNTWTSFCYYHPRYYHSMKAS